MEFDYIIVGAGSAGCVLANRLSAQQNRTVLLLEAGDNDRNFWVQTPLGYGKSINDPQKNWMFQSQKEAHLNNREIYTPRGKIIGGSSSINAMVYARGLDNDFEDWRKAGNPNWGSQEMREAFERIESEHHNLRATNSRRRFHQFADLIESAAAELDWNNSVDFNSENPKGVGPYQFNIHKGKRFSASDAFLRPIKSRQNLMVKTNSMVMKVIFAGKRAIGVSYKDNGIEITAHARAKVILSAGAIQTPQLLQLSGIGGGNDLRAAGIQVQFDNPNVGKNLQDHLCVSYSMDANLKTQNEIFGSALGRTLAGIRYVLTRGGPMSMSINQMGALLASHSRREIPDLQFYFNPIRFNRNIDAEDISPYPDKKSGVTFSVNACRPKSTGHVSVRSNDPNDAPEIHYNYLSHKSDIGVLLKGSKLIKKMLKTKALSEAIGNIDDIDLLKASDEQIIEDISKRASTVYHPCGTAKMASQAKGGVIDAHLNVYGMTNLAVVDASAFPNITSMNTNAPTMAFADHAARIIKADDR